MNADLFQLWLLVGMLLACMAAALLRITGERTAWPPNHLHIVGTAALAASLAVRIGSLLLRHIPVDWSMHVGAAGLLAMLASEPTTARATSRLWRRLSGRTGGEP